MTLKPFWL